MVPERNLWMTCPATLSTEVGVLVTLGVGPVTEHFPFDHLGEVGALGLTPVSPEREKLLPQGSREGMKATLVPNAFLPAPLNTPMTSPQPCPVVLTQSGSRQGLLTSRIPCGRLSTDPHSVLPCHSLS